MKLPSGFRPHKPATLENLEDLKGYPYYIQPKLDGLRCIIVDGKILSNTLKEFPNKNLPKHFEDLLGSNSLFEGELVIRKGTLQDVQSAVMSEDGDLTKVDLVLFDRVIDKENFTAPYGNRFGWLQDSFFKIHIIRNCMPILFYGNTYNIDAITNYENQAISHGYEGIIIRNPKAPYKFGRATLKEDTFYKFKRTLDAEARILETNVLEINHNSKEIDERGYTKRSSHGFNKEDSDMAGSLTVIGENGKYEGKIFEVSLGSCTYNVRRWFLEEEKKNKGRIVTFTFAKYRGTDNAPAEPRFKCFRFDI